jgi:CheY-like chemotaxis protein
MTLIDDIIDLSKIQSGSIKIFKKFFNVTDAIINSKVEFIQILTSRNKLNIDLVLNIDTIICKTYSDSSRIKQVLNNLVGNAIKFTDEGQITYGYKNKGDFIEFFVKDTGIGIEKENIELIFERFTQIDHKQKKRHDGTGLGLTISRAIVELLGGKLWVESIVGKGSTFFFTIQIDNTDDYYKKLIHLNTIKNINWEGKKVLIVEDNDVNFKLVSIYLKPNNIEIVRVIDSFDFYEIMDDSFDVVLMDIHLTNENGYILTNHIKNKYDNIPVIVTTAFASKEDEIKAYNNGADYYLTKPLKRNDLIDAMDRFIKK